MQKQVKHRWQWSRITDEVMKTSLTFIFLLVTISQVVTISQETLSQSKAPVLGNADRVRLAEAFRLGETLGNQVWPEWNKAPFAVLLVTPDHEFLIRHPKPSADFALLGHDSLLNSNVYFRKRVFQPHLLATFPAIQGSVVSTIVIGQAENTSKKTSTPWVITVLHEHFHQLQNSQPTYYEDVAALKLSGGDQTGMWMLNFPFPYKSPEVGQQFETLSRQLFDILQTKPPKLFRSKLKTYLEARQQFEKLLSPDDFRYFSFQVWQEGIARYTEYLIAVLAAKSYKPSREFKALSDYEPFSKVTTELKRNLLKELSTLKLAEHQRSAFYPFGAAEGLLLDRIKPNWRQRYFTQKFYVDRYFG